MYNFNYEIISGVDWEVCIHGNQRVFLAEIGCLLIQVNSEVEFFPALNSLNPNSDKHLIAT